MANVVIIILYLITCVCPFINTGEDWLLAFPGLVFPVILFALICFIGFWMILKSKWWVVCFITLILGFQQIFTAFAFHIPQTFSNAKAPHTLRVLQWNVEGWSGNRKTNDNSPGKMFEVIKKQDADVLCFEEYYDLLLPQIYKPTTTAIKTLGYPYYYFVPTEQDIGDYETGVAIFSKYPIIDSASFSFKENNKGEHLLYIDINMDGKIFRVFATHLQSVHFKDNDYRSLQQMKTGREASITDSKIIVSKLKKAYISRYKQATLVREKINESPYQSFICGDFNDVPNSSTYFKIKGNFQDAFLQKGFFMGRTFRFISPTLRIDYILADNAFKVTQFQRIKVAYSDHYPVEADLAY